MKPITEKQLTKACQLESSELGKWFEHKCEEWFWEAQENYPFKCIRLYDTHTAGNYMPATDGDYVIMSKGTGFLVEVKCSAKHSSLKSCLSSHLSKGQAQAQRLYARAGGVPVVVFASVSENVVEIWEGNCVGQARAKGVRLSVAECPYISGKLTDMDKLFYKFFVGSR